MSGSIFGSANTLYDPGSAVAQQSSLFGEAAPLGMAPGLGIPTNALAPAAPTTAATTTATPTTDAKTLTDQQIYDLLARTPMSEANAWANQQNQNVYHADPSTAQGQQNLAMLAGAGFPMFQNPAAIQDHLAQIAQGTIQVPGMSPEQARTALLQQINGGGYGGSYGDGGGGTGGNAGSSANTGVW